MHDSGLILPYRINSLQRVINIISLTNKITNESISEGILLYNKGEYDMQWRNEQALVTFIRDNFWYFLKEIIYKVSSQDFIEEDILTFDISTLNSQNTNFEYPRAFYKSRGSGVLNLSIEEQNKYDKRIKDVQNIFLEISPPLYDPIKISILKFVNRRIAGSILSIFSESSVGILHRFQIKEI